MWWNRWQMPSFRKVAYCILSVYLIITCCYVFHTLRRNIKSLRSDKNAPSKSISIADVVDDPDWNPWGEEFESEVQPLQHHLSPQLWQSEPNVSAHADAVNFNRIPTVNYGGARKARDLVTEKPKPWLTRESSSSDDDLSVVELWGKAAIGLYLWQHILDGSLEDRLNGIWRYGETTVSSIKFKFRTGPGVVPNKVPRDTEHLLLVLNGREAAKIETGKVWLDSLPGFPRLRNVAVLLLGREDCDNAWIHPYLAAHGGRVKALFVVYDSPEVDNVNVFQWPLGVATYRDFPVIKSSELHSVKERRYMFNFLGTIYQNSSREQLIMAVQSSAQKDLGYIRARAEWQPSETSKSREQYLHALSNSDLTLNPVGINSECYRIFEAMAIGSVPVLEDVMTPGHCGGPSVGSSAKESVIQSGTNTFKSHLHNSIVRTKFHSDKSSSVSSPYRLLKEFNAPVIYVKDWRSDLEAVLSREALLSKSDKIERRRALLKWYADFLAQMKHRLVSVLLEKFFGVHANL